MADNATNGGSQTMARETDAVIVPTIAGNAEVGKDWHTGRACPRDTFSILRDRRKNGNKTGQDRRNVSKQSEDGVHVAIPSNQRGTPTGVPQGNGWKESNRRRRRNQGRV